MDAEKMKKVLLLSVAVFLIILTILFAIITVLYAADYFWGIGIADTTEESRNSTILSLTCTTSLILLSVPLLYFYRKISKRVKLKEEIVAFLKFYRRISLLTIANNFNMSVPDMEKIILELISEGKIKAHLDRTTKEVFIEEAIGEAKVENIRCPNCGALVSGVYLIGEVVKCPYCGTAFKVEK